MRGFAGIAVLLLLSTGAVAGPVAANGLGQDASRPGSLILAQASRLSAEQSFKVTKFINTCDAYAEFLRSYPASRYAASARKWMQQKCRAKLVREVPSAETSEAASQGSAGTQATPESQPVTVRPKAKQSRQKSRNQSKAAKKKRAARSTSAARKPPVVRKKRSTVRRCRRETDLECIKRGGEFQFGQCDRQNVCD